MGRAMMLLVALAAVTAGAAAAECVGPIDAGRGPVTLFVPAGYDPQRPTPLVIGLHGYGADAVSQEAHFRFQPVADRRGVLYATPDGTRDVYGDRYWDAAPGCCNFFGPPRDDVGYLLALLDEIERRCNVDPAAVYFVGGSNGGWMSYRMACAHAERIAAVASIAGLTAFAPGACSPAKPVHVLQVHGTADEFWYYDGGWGVGGPFLGALANTRRWAAMNGCSPDGMALPERLDLDLSIPGAESSVVRWESGCRPGGSAELWTLEGAIHVPRVNQAFRERLFDDLLAHRLRCSGSERVERVACARSGRRLVVRLAGGLPRDVFAVELEGGERRTGRLDREGRRVVRFRDPARGPGALTATWGCRASRRVDFECR